jgi:hypothetical protein
MAQSSGPYGTLADAIQGIPRQERARGAVRALEEAARAALEARQHLQQGRREVALMSLITALHELFDARSELIG